MSDTFDDILVADLRDEIDRLKAEVERLRALCSRVAAYANEVRSDRPVREDGEIIGHWQTEAWINVLRDYVVVLDKAGRGEG